jgi:hypothetical protein
MSGVHALVDRGRDQRYKVKVLAPASGIFVDSGDAGSGKPVSDR